MNSKQLGLGIVLAALVAFDGWVIYQFGYIGIFRLAFANPVNLLMAIDGVIGLAIALVLLGRDAAEQRISFVPYVVLTLALGSVGPLVYLVRRSGTESRDPASDSRALASSRG